MKILLWFSVLGMAIGLNNTDETISLDELKSLYENPSKDITIINFWASWCGPCVREMSTLDKVGQNENVELYFISLDFKQDLEKASKILNKKNIKSKNYFIDEKDPDKMIRSIHDSWSGAIPATLFVHKSGKKVFHEAELTNEEIDQIIEKLKNSK